MRNGTRFSRLTRVNGSQEDGDDPAAYFPYRPDGEDAAEHADDSKHFLIFLTLSISCAAAAVATGSYAVWLARRQAARRTLTDVDDILRSCQSRMSQLESDLQRLPSHRE